MNPHLKKVGKFTVSLKPDLSMIINTERDLQAALLGRRFEYFLAEPDKPIIVDNTTNRMFYLTKDGLLGNKEYNEEKRRLKDFQSNIENFLGEEDER